MAEASEIDTKHCEACDREIGPTEARYHAFDCDLCIGCAPTWEEGWRVRMERVSEAVADGDDDEATRWRLAAEEIAAKISAGLDPDAKAVSLPDITSEDMH